MPTSDPIIVKTALSMAKARNTGRSDGGRRDGDGHSGGGGDVVVAGKQ